MKEKKTCFWFHIWGKWSDPLPAEQAFNYFLRASELPIDHIQRRVCERCNRIDEQSV